MKTLIHTATALIAFGLTGCYTDTAPIGADVDDAIDYPQITLSQRSLEAALAFQKPVVTRIDGDLLRVTVPVRARSNETLHVEYKVVWLDVSGNPVPPDLIWTPLRLEPRQPHNVVVNSTSPQATDFNMQFRWSKP